MNSVLEVWGHMATLGNSDVGENNSFEVAKPGD
jgi:hypothetical protein